MADLRLAEDGFGAAGQADVGRILRYFALLDAAGGAQFERLVTAVCADFVGWEREILGLVLGTCLSCTKGCAGRWPRIVVVYTGFRRAVKCRRNGAW